MSLSYFLDKPIPDFGRSLPPTPAAFKFAAVNATAFGVFVVDVFGFATLGLLFSGVLALIQK